MIRIRGAGLREGMKIPRIYSDVALLAGKEVVLHGDRHHYLTHVLRLSAGDPVALFNDAGEFHCRIVAVERNRSILLCARRVASLPASRLQVTLHVCLAKSRSMDLAVQKATELGVAVIQPVAAARSVVSLAMGTRRLPHWRGITRSACEQCGRGDVPVVTEPLPLKDVTVPRDTVALVLDPDCRRSLTTELRASQGSRFAVLVGPEGGLIEGEVADVVRRGFTPVSLGPRLLRVETAVAVALGVLQALLGDFAEPTNHPGPHPTSNNGKPRSFRRDV